MGGRARREAPGWRVVAAPFVAAMSLVLGAAPARAQPPRIDVAVAGAWSSGAALGGPDASLRANGGAGPYRLFASRTTLEGGSGIEVRMAVALGRRLAIEARGSRGAPELVTSTSADVEGAAAARVRERVEAYGLDGGLVLRWPAWRAAGIEPFVEAGAGYLRLRHEGRLLIDEGVTYHAGAGARRTLWTRPRGVVRTIGVSGDVRFVAAPGGLGLTGRALRRTVVTAGLVAGF